MKKTPHGVCVSLLCAVLVASGCGLKANEITVPEGRQLTVALDERLRTDTHESGDDFTAHTVSAVTLKGKTAIPAGSTVRGHLSHVEEPHRTAGKAEMTLSFDEIVDAEGNEHSISAEPIVLVGKGDKISDEEKVAGGAVIGGILGALTSKKKTSGAVTGAVVGAAAGGAIALATKSGQLDLPPGKQFTVELTDPVDVEIASRDQ